MSKNWFEDDALWQDLSPVLFTEERLAETEEEVDALVAILGLAPGARVLDLCCGTGRHALELARRGYRVTGVDRTGHFLEKARVAARLDGVELELVQADAREFRRPGAFDAAINLFHSFGFFPDPEDDFVVLDNVHASLTERGQLVIELMGKEILAAASTQPRDWKRLDDGRILLEERRVEPGWEWIRTEWTLISDDTRRTHTFGMRPYSAAELSALARRVGFTATETLGELTTEKSPYDADATRLVLHARR